MFSNKLVMVIGKNMKLTTVEVVDVSRQISLKSKARDRVAEKSNFLEIRKFISNTM